MAQTYFSIQSVFQIAYDFRFKQSIHLFVKNTSILCDTDLVEMEKHSEQ